MILLVIGYHFLGVAQGVLVIKNLPANEGDVGSVPGLGGSPEGGNGNPFQCSCLEKFHGQRNPVGYRPWGLKESDTTEHRYISLPRLIKKKNRRFIRSQSPLSFPGSKLDVLPVTCALPKLPKLEIYNPLDFVFQEI